MEIFNAYSVTAQLMVNWIVFKVQGCWCAVFKLLFFIIIGYEMAATKPSSANVLFGWFTQNVVFIDFVDNWCHLGNIQCWITTMWSRAATEESVITLSNPVVVHLLFISLFRSLISWLNCVWTFEETKSI